MRNNQTRYDPREVINTITSPLPFWNTIREVNTFVGGFAEVPSGLLEYMTLNKREGELFKRGFWKLFQVEQNSLCESRTWIKLAKNISNYTTKQQKKIGCFLETIGCLYQQSLKQNLNEFRVREKYTNSLYWFTLKPRATSSSQNPLGNPLSNQNQITQTQTTKVVTLNPSRNTLPLANHTKSIDLEYLKNTQHSLATQIQKYSRFRKDYTWSQYRLNWIQ